MKWLLIISVYTSIGIDSGIMQGYVAPPPTKYQVYMPSQEICEQVVKLNQNAECWAKAEIKDK